MVERTEWA